MSVYEFPRNGGYQVARVVSCQVSLAVFFVKNTGISRENFWVIFRELKSLNFSKEASMISF